MALNTGLRNIACCCVHAMIYLAMGMAQSLNNGEWMVVPSIGYHQTDFDWSIAGNTDGENPNIFSELVWRDLRGVQGEASVRYGLSDRMHIKLDTRYAQISGGQVTDTDYSGDNRKGVFARDVLPSNRGYEVAAGLGVDYQIYERRSFELRPTLGAAVRQHTYYLLEQPGVEETRGLESTYATQWLGGYLGLDAYYTVSGLAINAGVALGISHYAAMANWNLIPEFAHPVSFRQRALAYSFDAAIDLSYPIAPNFYLQLQLSTTQARSQKGVDRAYYVDRSPEETQFNGARGSTYRTGLGVGYVW